jgi:hypothetical protein
VLEGSTSGRTHSGGPPRHPSAPHDQRTSWAYIFGVTCPAKGKGAGLVLPYCDTKAMAAQLAEVSQNVALGAHAVLLVDQAGMSRPS